MIGRSPTHGSCVLGQPLQRRVRFANYNKVKEGEAYNKTHFKCNALKAKNDWPIDHSLNVDLLLINFTYLECWTLILWQLRRMEYFIGKRERIQFKGLDTSEQTEDWAAAIAQWNGQRLPSSRPGFESHAHHIAQVESIFAIWTGMWKERKKWPGLSHLKNSC